MNMKRWHGIRHIRYLYQLWRFKRWWKKARKRYLVPSPLDLEYLEGIKEGAW